MAAVLACGDGAVLSHRDAATLWGIRASAASGIDVTVPSRGGRAAEAGSGSTESACRRRDDDSGWHPRHDPLARSSTSLLSFPAMR